MRLLPLWVHSLPHLGSVGAPHLCAVEDVPVALALSPCAHADSITACARLTDGQRTDVLACTHTCVKGVEAAYRHIDSIGRSGGAVSGCWVPNSHGRHAYPGNSLSTTEPVGGNLSVTPRCDTHN